MKNRSILNKKALANALQGLLIEQMLKIGRKTKTQAPGGA